MLAVLLVTTEELNPIASDHSMSSKKDKLLSKLVHLRFLAVLSDASF